MELRRFPRLAAFLLGCHSSEEPSTPHSLPAEKTGTPATVHDSGWESKPHGVLSRPTGMPVEANFQRATPLPMLDPPTPSPAVDSPLPKATPPNEPQPTDSIPPEWREVLGNLPPGTPIKFIEAPPIVTPENKQAGGENPVAFSGNDRPDPPVETDCGEICLPLAHAGLIDKHAQCLTQCRTGDLKEKLKKLEAQPAVFSTGSPSSPSPSGAPGAAPSHEFDEKTLKALEVQLMQQLEQLGIDPAEFEKAVQQMAEPKR